MKDKMPKCKRPPIWDGLFSKYYVRVCEYMPPFFQTDDFVVTDEICCRNYREALSWYDALIASATPAPYHNMSISMSDRSGVIIYRKVIKWRKNTIQ